MKKTKAPPSQSQLSKEQEGRATTQVGVYPSLVSGHRPLLLTMLEGPCQLQMLPPDASTFSRGDGLAPHLLVPWLGRWSPRVLFLTGKCPQGAVLARRITRNLVCVLAGKGQPLHFPQLHPAEVTLWLPRPWIRRWPGLHHQGRDLPLPPEKMAVTGLQPPRPAGGTGQSTLGSGTLAPLTGAQKGLDPWPRGPPLRVRTEDIPEEQVGF